MTLAAADRHAALAAEGHEATLVARARRMEAAAWDELYSLHYPAIFRYCSFRIAERECAEDLAADVFLEAVKGIGRYRFRGRPFRAWLYRIAHNLTVDELRRRARAGSVAQLDLEAVTLADGVGFEGGVLDRRAISAALLTLTDDQQQVVLLRFVAGLSLREVSEVMKRPTGAVKTLQHRAVVRMRAQLAAGGD